MTTIPPTPIVSQGPFATQSYEQQVTGRAESKNVYQGKRIAFLCDDSFGTVAPLIIGANIQAQYLANYYDPVNWVRLAYKSTATYPTVSGYIDNFPATKYDVVIISIGYNDVSTGSNIATIGTCWTTDTSSRVLNVDNTEIAGAVNYTLGVLREANPNLIIVWCSIPKTTIEDTENLNGSYTSDYNTVIKTCCQENSIPYIDIYSSSQVNSLGSNATRYYTTESFPTPNAVAQAKIGTFVAQQLLYLV
jgi:hypothetical protein